MFPGHTFTQRLCSLYYNTQVKQGLRESEDNQKSTT